MIEKLEPPIQQNQPNNPFHHLTLEKLLTHLIEYYGWDEMGSRINIKCFNSNPSMKSSLIFLRKNPWARKKVEELFLTYQWELSNSAEGQP